MGRNKYFSNDQMASMAEARRAVSLEQAEANVTPLTAAQQRMIAEKLSHVPQQKAEKAVQKQQKQTQKKKKSGSGDTANYMGSKK